MSAVTSDTAPDGAAADVQPDWREFCDEQRLDPLLVERIARRYRSYAEYTRDQGRPVIELQAWFGWYAIENADQVNADAATPASCSVTTTAIGAPRADRSRALLEALRLALGFRRGSA